MAQRDTFKNSARVTAQRDEVIEYNGYHDGHFVEFKENVYSEESPDIASFYAGRQYWFSHTIPIGGGVNVLIYTS